MYDCLLLEYPTKEDKKRPTPESDVEKLINMYKTNTGGKQIRNSLGLWGAHYFG